LNQYLRDKFGAKVHKVTVDAHFTCPNRDGTLGRGGCTYCNNAGFSVNSRAEPGSSLSVREQIEAGIEFKRRRFKAEKFLVYFQAYTNTYGPIEHLRELYDTALSIPDVVGLDIGTRPDCVANPVLDLIESYASRTEVWLEYGLQTTHDRTLELIHRGHDYAAFVDAMERTRGRGIKICVHVILGLPGETHEDMMVTAERLGRMEFQGIKIHLLHILRDTPMARQYAEGEVSLLSLPEYASLVVDFLEYIPPQVTIHRMSGDAPPSMLIAPEWCLNKTAVLRTIEEEMRRRDFHQGSRRNPSESSKKGPAFQKENRALSDRPDPRGRN
jgi:radical SAM protein (TIGR01212 family)